MSLAPSDSPDSTTEEQSADSTNQEEQPQKQALLAPGQVFKQAYKDKQDIKKQLSQATESYWQLLTLCLLQKNNQKVIKFSDLERAFYSFGVWSGEQFSHVEEVQEFLDNKDINEQEVFKAVFSELLDEIKQTKYSFPVLTITQWLELRDQSYRLFAESEHFQISDEVIRLLPKEDHHFLSLRKERLEKVQSLKTIIDKLPGVQPKLKEVFLKGSLLDETDFLSCQKSLRPADQLKFKKLSELWDGFCKKIATLFPVPAVNSCLNRIHELSLEIKQLSLDGKVDLEKSHLRAHKLFVSPKSSDKRLNRDIMILKNNLAVGSIKSTRHAHAPFALKWPKPISPQDIDSWCKQLLTMDSHFNSRTHILLAPGHFSGFYEFDRGTIIIPMYTEDLENDLISALVDYHIITEALVHSTFIDDLKKLSSRSTARKNLRNTLSKWLKTNSSSNNPEDILFSEAEKNFIVKYLAISHHTLFLRREIYFSNQQSKAKLLNECKNESLDASGYHQVAGIFHSLKKYSQALNYINKAQQLEPENQSINLAKAYLLALSEKKGEAESV
ncbi:MAG: hypothetical protein HQL32_15975, partial [Planctomycetes bacterium]|nr:hypothetical protein [Planctomycetota bacterium]